jgi:hypothetical protein
MLDDMADSDPEKYQKFIQKQMAERKKYMEENRPPEKRFAVKTKMV